MVGEGLHGVNEPQVAGHGGLASLQDHALLVDLLPSPLQADVRADHPPGDLAISMLHGLAHHLKPGLNLPAEAQHPHQPL